MDSSPRDRVFIDETPTIAFAVPAGVGAKASAPEPQPEWPAALGKCAAVLWIRLRAYWAQRTTGDRVVLIGLGAVVLMLVGGGIATSSAHSSSISSSSTSTTTWYADLGPIGLSTNAVTYYGGEAFNTPLPSAADRVAFTRDTGATDYTFGLMICSHVRYGNTSFTEARSAMSIGQTDAMNLVRSSLLDLCPVS